MKAKKPPRANVTDKHYKAIQWCLKNNIRIYPRPLLSGGYNLIYEKDGYPRTSGKLYDREQLYQAIWDFWLFTYETLAEKKNKP